MLRRELVLEEEADGEEGRIVKSTENLQVRNQKLLTQEHELAVREQELWPKLRSRGVGSHVDRVT